MTTEKGEADVIKEFLNIGMGRAAGILNKLVSQHINMIPPEFVETSGDHFSHEEKNPAFVIYQEFSGELDGFGVLLFDEKSGKQLGQLVARNAGEETYNDEDLHDIVSEVGNNTINAIAGTLVDQVRNKVSFSPPALKIGCQSDILMPILKGWEKVVFGRAGFSIRDYQIEGLLILGFSETSYHRFLDIVKKIVLDVDEVG